ncbi:MAG TPA: ATP-binding protein [Gemmataceae bacterium]|nr:ATP-binding protein [Gemmataceae bacterium]
MRAFEPGEAVAHLPWLSPGVAALTRLTRPHSSTLWQQLRVDPGAVLLLLRNLPSEAPPNLKILEAALRSPDLLDLARQNLTDHAAGFVDWSNPAVRPVYEASVHFARLAWLLAQRIGCNPACAWIGGLLAPLGWLAVSAVDADSVGECLQGMIPATRLAEVQRQNWGQDAPAVARRLARRWQLPLWLHAVVGYLGMPLEHAEALGTDERLFAIVQWAVTLGQVHDCCLGLAVGSDRPRLQAYLGLSTQDESAILNAWEELTESEPLPAHWPEPHNEPLLLDLLAVASESRRRESRSFTERMEQEIDWLQQQLAELKSSEGERLNRSKLRALAEFAAGAGHEINNPLAVISGQAQYLMAREGDSDREKSLQVILRQTDKIHQLLNELMQFAKPPLPRRQVIDLVKLVCDVSLELQNLADERACRVELIEPSQSAFALADLQMTRTALRCLLRNALEASPRDSIVHVQLESSEDAVQITVTDRGPGPNGQQREHMFDPFYSGRRAGRGRGLGLPTAWRLARENGGDVQYSPLPEAPARFVLTLPAAAPLSQPANSHDETLPERKIA